MASPSSPRRAKLSLRAVRTSRAWASGWWSKKARRFPISAASRPSSVRCSRQSPSRTSIRPRAARAGFISQAFSRSSALRRRSSRRRSKQGGYVAELIANGEAELGLHQISEILPVKGVKLVGPLPAEVQNYTSYAAAVTTSAKQPDAAQALIKLLTGPAADSVLKARGMERPPS